MKRNIPIYFRDNSGAGGESVVEKKYWCILFYLLQSVVFLRVITIMTPKSTKHTPAAILKVISSWKNIIPKNIAVKGSSAPNIAVLVEPINFMAIFIVSMEITVGNIASPAAHSHI